MAWKKEVERIKDKIERDRDAYVARRRKQLRAEAVKEGQAQTKVLAEVKKHAEARDKSSASSPGIRRPSNSSGEERG